MFDPVYLPDDNQLPDILEYPGEIAAGPDNSAISSFSDLQLYQDNIRDTETELGLYSPQLRQQYQALAKLQQELGFYEQAIASFEQSMHIVRVNQGLFSEQQISDIYGIIENAQLLKDHEREAEFRSYLYYVQSKAYPDGDERLIAARRAWAKWTINNFRRDTFLNPYSVQMKGSTVKREFIAVRNTISGQTRFIDRSSIGLSSTTSAYSPEQIIDNRIHTVRDIYKDLQEDSAQLSLQEKLEFEVRLMEADYALKKHMDGFVDNIDPFNSTSLLPSSFNRNLSMVNRNFKKRLNSLLALLEEATQHSPPDYQLLAQINLYLGDLHIVHKRSAIGEKYYQAANDALRSKGLNEAEISQFMLPEPAYTLPDYSPRPYSRTFMGIADGDMQEYQGYIDVSFTINRYGNVRGASISQTSDDTPQRIRNNLLGWLRHQNMRPAFTNDGYTEQENIRIRFYYSY